MILLLRKLLHDTVGSTLSAEMALVTSVTVGALVLGLGNFSGKVNHRFGNVANSGALTARDLEQERKDEDAERKAEFERKKTLAKQQREEHKNAP